MGYATINGDMSGGLSPILDVTKTKKVKGLEVASEVLVQVMDNTGELGKGQVFRKAVREDLYKALDIGEWWLKDALKQFA